MPILIHMPVAMMLLRRRHKFISFWNHGTPLTNHIYQICSNFLDDATLFSNEVIFHTSANIYSHDPGRYAYLLRRRSRENLLKDKKTGCLLQRFWVAVEFGWPPGSTSGTACYRLLKLAILFCSNLLTARFRYLKYFWDVYWNYARVSAVQLMLLRLGT